MKFEWDENKRQENIRKHGFDFADVWRVFESETYTVVDDRFDYGEIRYFTLGLMFGRIVAVSFTETDEVLRIISVRKGGKNDEEEYFRNIAD
jgi:uncharacterized DUF497 family protein